MKCQACNHAESKHIQRTLDTGVPYDMDIRNPLMRIGTLELPLQECITCNVRHNIPDWDKHIYRKEGFHNFTTENITKREAHDRLFKYLKTTILEYTYPYFNGSNSSDPGVITLDLNDPNITFV